MNRRNAIKLSAFAFGAMTNSGFASAARLYSEYSPSPIATTKSGKIAGYVDRGVSVFRGIPFGADTKTCRFMPAGPAEPWQGVRTTEEYGAAAPQQNIKEKISEDCLFLNIWTPALRDQGHRPIMVYLHGGEYSSGSGSDTLYDGVNLCHRGDVVVITLNHRLNVFGHLFLGALDRDKYKSSGNVGLLDIVLALQWIQSHAIEFGGDPKRVMLFGQSGGGAKIACLMAMPKARGLFNRLATMSGQQITGSGPRAAANRAQVLLEGLKIPTSEMASLIQLPTAQLLAGASIADPSLPGRSLYFGPVLDDAVLMRHPFYPDAPALSKDIPMIIGNTHDETRYFYSKDDSLQTLDWKDLPDKLRDAIFVDINIDPVINAYRRHYPHYTASEVFFAASTAGRSWRGAVIEAELRAMQGAPAYVYQLDFPSPVDNGKWRACHTLDIPLVFNNIDNAGSKTGTSVDAQKLSMQMCDAFIRFAKTGDPNHRNMPQWRPYTLTNRSTMIFDKNSHMENDPRGFERQLFSQVPYIQRGTF